MLFVAVDRHHHSFIITTSRVLPSSGSVTSSMRLLQLLPLAPVLQPPLRLVTAVAKALPDLSSEDNLAVSAPTAARLLIFGESAEEIIRRYQASQAQTPAPPIVLQRQVILAGLVCFVVLRRLATSGAPRLFALHVGCMAPMLPLGTAAVSTIRQRKRPPAVPIREPGGRKKRAEWLVIRHFFSSAAALYAAAVGLGAIYLQKEALGRPHLQTPQCACRPRALSLHRPRCGATHRCSLPCRMRGPTTLRTPRCRPPARARHGARPRPRTRRRAPETPPAMLRACKHTTPSRGARSAFAGVLAFGVWLAAYLSAQPHVWRDQIRARRFSLLRNKVCAPAHPRRLCAHPRRRTARSGHARHLPPTRHGPPLARDTIPPAPALALRALCGRRRAPGRRARARALAAVAVGR
eukprot:7267119-Prymnesium_polylepis.1